MTLFAQVMEFVPWTSFARIVQRRGGDAGVRTLSCAEQFRAMAFAQLTWRESLRDIEASLSANASKLYAMGFRSAVKRSTLGDANESRDWRIWSDLGALLIRRALKLYSNDRALGIDLDNTVYALDSSTIDLCLSLFEWVLVRSTKAAIKVHTLLDLRGAIPAFIRISDGKLHDVNVLDMLAFEAGAFYVMDRGYVDFARLYALHQAGVEPHRIAGALSGVCRRRPDRGLDAHRSKIFWRREAEAVERRARAVDELAHPGRRRVGGLQRCGIDRSVSADTELGLHVAPESESLACGHLTAPLKGGRVRDQRRIHVVERIPLLDVFDTDTCMGRGRRLGPFPLVLHPPPVHELFARDCRAHDEIQRGPVGEAWLQDHAMDPLQVAFAPG
jgi:hypothetical protein